MSISWDFGDNKFCVEKRESWHEFSATKERYELRKNFIALGSSDIPFRSFLLFPQSPPTVVVRLYCTWELAKTVALVKDVVEGTLCTKFAALSLPTDRCMKLPYSITPSSCYLRRMPDYLVRRVKTHILVDDIAFIHFLSNKLTKSEKIVIGRELRENKLLSEARRNAHPLLQGTTFGVTLDSDRKRGDDRFTHCFLAFPTHSNKAYIHRIPSDLAKDAMLQIAYQDHPEVIILPCDMEMDISQGIPFTFLGIDYEILFDENTKTISYVSKTTSRLLFSHRYADETFIGKARPSLNACFTILGTFIAYLDDDEQEQVFGQPELLKELFNALFAFRLQVSVPGELTCTPYNAKDFPRTKITQMLRQPLVMRQALSSSEDFDRIYASLSTYMPPLSPETIFALEKITGFFRTPFDDGVNQLPNAFAYYGATSSQLMLHFAPELMHLFTECVVRELMQLYKACQHDSHPHLKKLYQKYLLIKNTPDGDITVFSLIKHGLKDLDPVQCRLPPNRCFTRSLFEAEHDYLLQLETLQKGSPLLLAISSLAKTPLSLMPFSQDRHFMDTTTEAIDRLRYTVYCPEAIFSNVHGYTSDAFLGEFERGIENFIDRFELTHSGVVQTHIVDFVKRVVTGSELLEPCFRHDILDLKHFIAGLSSYLMIEFIDGKATFRELVLRCLYEIPHHEISINSQLLVDTLYLFMKMVPATHKPITAGEDPSPTIQALSKLHVQEYESTGLGKILALLDMFKEEQYSYIVKCLNILRLRNQNDFIPADDLDDPLRAIRQKLTGMNPDLLSEEFFILLPDT